MDGDDWQPGDLALCLHTRPRNKIVWGGLERLKAGAVYTIAGTYHAVILALVFVEVKSDCPRGGGFWAGRFMKLPKHEADEYDQEIISLMNTQPTPQREGV